jgi:hypothetical protein
VIAIVAVAYLGFLLVTSVRKRASRDPNPIEQFQERAPFGSGELAGRPQVAEALRGNGADQAPKFDD